MVDNNPISNQPVSRKLPNNDGIESAYLTISSLPSVDSFELNVAFSHFVTSLVFADLYRSERALSNLSSSFSNVLCACKTQEDLDKFKKQFNSLAQKGGYAAEYYVKKEKMITPAVSRILAKAKARDEAKKVENGETNSFLERYREAKERLDNVLTSSTLRENDVADLLADFNSLQGDLYRLGSKLDKKTIVDVDRELDAGIEWLRSAYQSLEADKEIWRSL